MHHFQRIFPRKSYLRQKYEDRISWGPVMRNSLETVKVISVSTSALAKRVLSSRKQTNYDEMCREENPSIGTE
jgi:hypothetical protein